MADMSRSEVPQVDALPSSPAGSSDEPTAVPGCTVTGTL